MSADLLAIARAIVSPQADAASDAALASEGRVKLLSPRAMAALEDTLAKGSVRMLARLGGARAAVRADTGSITPARVYDVRSVPALAFGRNTFELLRWLTRSPLGLSTVTPLTSGPVTAGDELVAYLTHRLVSGRRFERSVALSLNSALAALGFARALARACERPEVPSFDALLASPEGRTVIECLADDLAARWAATATWTEASIDASVAIRIVTFERATLDAFLDAVARHDRWDLATFLVDATATALSRARSAPSHAGVTETIGLAGAGPEPPEAVAARAAPPVLPAGTLRARTEARQRAGALFHVAARLARQYEAAAHVRHIDDGYEQAQALLTSWSSLGREGFARAAAVVAELGAFRSLP